jgi:hypothetical protein
MRSTSSINVSINAFSSEFVGSPGSSGVSAGGDSGHVVGHSNARATPVRTFGVTRPLSSNDPHVVLLI